MGVVHWDVNLILVGLGLEGGWLVHVIPDSIHVVGSLEHRWMEQRLVVLLSLLVQEVEPDRSSREALSLIWILAGLVSNKDVLDESIMSLVSLQLQSLGIDKVLIADTNVRIDNGDESTA